MAAALVWQDVIERHVAGASRVGAGAGGRGLVAFRAAALVDLLVQSRRVGSRAAGAALGEALRARDVIRAWSLAPPPPASAAAAALAPGEAARAAEREREGGAGAGEGAGAR